MCGGGESGEDATGCAYGDRECTEHFLQCARQYVHDKGVMVAYNNWIYQCQRSFPVSAAKSTPSTSPANNSSAAPSDERAKRLEAAKNRNSRMDGTNGKTQADFDNKIVSDRAAVVKKQKEDLEAERADVAATESEVEARKAKIASQIPPQGSIIPKQQYEDWPFSYYPSKNEMLVIGIHMTPCPIIENLQVCTNREQRTLRAFAERGINVLGHCYRITALAIVHKDVVVDVICYTGTLEN